MQQIAEIKLGYGQVGFYDNLTGIHLTISRNAAPVLAGMNLQNIKSAVNYKIIEVVSGSLDATSIKKEVKTEHESDKPKVVEKIEEGIIDIPTELLDKKQEEIVEAVQEKIVETAQEEKPVKKKKTKESE